MIKVCIADDQQLIRESLKLWVESQPDFQVSGTAGDGIEVLEQLKVSLPDVILMDIRMPKLDGVQCTKKIKELYPQVKVIILTTFDDDDYVYNALKYGASGYLLKGIALEELCSAIKTVYSGQAMINPDIASKVLQLFYKMANEGGGLSSIDEKRTESLTKTEWKVIREIEKGKSNKEIAQTLCLSEGTVRNYLSTILDKLDLRDRTQLAIWAVQMSLSV
ncbi:MAG: response regulator transcription factor [Treponema sp.]|nr:response regulator transcription factor [Treponema sp.]